MMAEKTRILLISGGAGGAKLARGFAALSDQLELMIVTNIGDDFEHLGLYICPDTDSVLYALSDQLDTDRGWGRAGESWRVLESLAQLGGKDWFRLGDQDLATHLFRTDLIRSGYALGVVTQRLADGLGLINLSVQPASDQPVRTHIETPGGLLDFQTYFVANQCAPVVNRVHYHGAEAAVPCPAINDFVKRGVDAVIMGPSNPFLSVAPVLAISGMVELLQQAKHVIAVSPIVGNRALKGPLAKMMEEMGVDASALNWAQQLNGDFPGFVDSWIFDKCDTAAAELLKSKGLHVKTFATVMSSLDQKIDLAQNILALIDPNV